MRIDEGERGVTGQRNALAGRRHVDAARGRLRRPAGSRLQHRIEIDMLGDEARGLVDQLADLRLLLGLYQSEMALRQADLGVAG